MAARRFRVIERQRRPAYRQAALPFQTALVRMGLQRLRHSPQRPDWLLASTRVHTLQEGARERNPAFRYPTKLAVAAAL